MGDRHRLCITVKQPGPTRYEVGEYPTFDAAIAAWQRLDKALRAGRLFERLAESRSIRRQVKVRPLTADTAFLSVRDVADPGWYGLPRMDVVVTTTSRGAKHEDDVLKRLGKKAGVHGHEGGWIYSGGPRKVIDSYGFEATSHEQCRLLPYQGWGSWGHNRAPEASVAVGLADGFIRYWEVER